MSAHTRQHYVMILFCCVALFVFRGDTKPDRNLYVSQDYISTTVERSYLCVCFRTHSPFLLLVGYIIYSIRRFVLTLLRGNIEIIIKHCNKDRGVYRGTYDFGTHRGF